MNSKGIVEMNSKVAIAELGTYFLRSAGVSRDRSGVPRTIVPGGSLGWDLWWVECE